VQPQLLQLQQPIEGARRDLLEPVLIEPQHLQPRQPLEGPRRQAVDVVPGQVELGKAGELVEQPLLQLLQVVPVQLQLLEVAQVGKVGRLDLEDLVAGEKKRLQLVQRLEDLHGELLQLVAGQAEVAQVGQVLEGPGADARQVVLLNAQPDQQGGVAEGRVAQLGDVCVDDLERHGVRGDGAGDRGDAGAGAFHLGGADALALLRALATGQLDAHHQQQPLLPASLLHRACSKSRGGGLRPCGFPAPRATARDGCCFPPGKGHQERGHPAPSMAVRQRRAGEEGWGQARRAGQSRGPRRLAAIPQLLVASLASPSLGSSSGQEGGGFLFCSERGQLLPAARASRRHRTAGTFAGAGQRHSQPSGSQGCWVGAGKKVVPQPPQGPSWLYPAASSFQTPLGSQDQCWHLLPSSGLALILQEPGPMGPPASSPAQGIGVALSAPQPQQKVLVGTGVAQSAPQPQQEVSALATVGCGSRVSAVDACVWQAGHRGCAWGSAGAQGQ